MRSQTRYINNPVIICPTFATELSHTKSLQTMTFLLKGEIHTKSKVTFFVFK